MRRRRWRFRQLVLSPMSNSATAQTNHAGTLQPAAKGLMPTSSLRKRDPHSRRLFRMAGESRAKQHRSRGDRSAIRSSGIQRAGAGETSQWPRRCVADSSVLRWKQTCAVATFYCSVARRSRRNSSGSFLPHGPACYWPVLVPGAHVIVARILSFLLWWRMR